MPKGLEKASTPTSLNHESRDGSTYLRRTSIPKGLLNFVVGEITLAKRLSREEKIARFWSRTTEHEEAGCIEYTGPVNEDGYGTHAQIDRDGTHAQIDRERYAHRIAWMLVNGAIAKGTVIRHKRCRNRLCVNVEHLALGTYRENSQDMVADGMSCKGEKNPRAKLTDAEAAIIRADDSPLRHLAERYGVTIQTIHNIKSGKTFKHLKGPIIPSRPLMGVERGHVKLSDAEVIAIFKDPRSGPEVAIEYGVTESHVSLIRSRRRRADVTGIHAVAAD